MAGQAPFLEAYRGSRASFAATLRSIDAMALSDPQREQSAAIAKLEEQIHKALSTTPPSPELSIRLATDFSRLATRSQSLVSLGEGVIEEGIERLRAQAVKSRSNVFWLMVALIPTAILLIASFTFLIARPINQVGSAIRRLGHGEFARAIAIEGPGDMVRLGEQLDWLRRRLVTLEEQKTRFLQHISHELKTPLTALREGSDLLSSGVVGNLNAEQYEIARILRENSIELRKLIEGLLNYSAVHAQASFLDSRIVPLRDVVNARGERPQARDGGARHPAGRELRERDRVLRRGEDPRDAGQPPVQRGRVLPERGLVTVKVYKEHGDAVFEVADEGPGIPTPEREKVFEAFYRGTDAPIAAIKGSRLGLSIVKEYVRLPRGPWRCSTPGRPLRASASRAGATRARAWRRDGRVLAAYGDPTRLVPPC